MRPADAQAIVTSLGARTGEMAGLLERLIECESPSGDREALAQAFELLAAELEQTGFEVARLPARVQGDTLEARPRDAVDAGPHQLLVGHMDTVWPRGTVAERPPARQGDELAGPGAYDMKAGLVQMIFALRVLRELDLRPPLIPVVLVNADEEVGSRESREHLVRLAGGAARAFILEPSFGVAGSLKTARKGIGRFTVTVKGRASHAGLAPEAGISAILEASHQVQELFSLNDLDRGITVNVGTIDGGLRANVVAPEVVASVEVRVATAADGDEVERAIRALEPVQEGAEVTVEGGFGRPPLERTQRNLELWEAARRAGRDLGIELQQAAVGGASDGNITSLYTATLDGLGAVGGGAHAVDEHVVLSRMPERAALLALLLLAEPAGEAPR
jgi:glutamate carboxypeptidase